MASQFSSVAWPQAVSVYHGEHVRIAKNVQIPGEFMNESADPK